MISQFTPGYIRLFQVRVGYFMLGQFTSRIITLRLVMSLYARCGLFMIGEDKLVQIRQGYVRLVQVMSY